MKIRVKDKSVIEHGKVNLPQLGIVNVPADGVIDVSDELGNHLITHAPDGWAKHHFQTAAPAKTVSKGAKPSKKVETAVESASESNEADESEEEDNETVSPAEQRKDLLKKDVETLRSIASALELPQEEYENLKKNDLVNYILSKSED